MKVAIHRLRTRFLELIRSEWDAPEIDGPVMLDESLPVGEFADITIGDWRGYDLVAAR